MTHADFEQVYYPKYAAVIESIAYKLANHNDTLAQDLVQEGLIALWQCDPEQARSNQDAYIRQAVKFRMIDFLRRQKLSEQESLETHLDNGRQIVRLDDGQLQLTRFRNRSGQRNQLSDEFTPDADDEAEGYY